MSSKVWGEIITPVSTFNDCSVEVWRWIGNFNLQFILHVFTFPCRDQSKTMLVKGFHVVMIHEFEYMPARCHVNWHTVYNKTCVSTAIRMRNWVWKFVTRMLNTYQSNNYHIAIKHSIKTKSFVLTHSILNISFVLFAKLQIASPKCVSKMALIFCNWPLSLLWWYEQKPRHYRFSGCQHQI